MKIRFATRDGLVAVKECPNVEPPVIVIMSPMWHGVPTLDGKQPDGFMEHRRYEFRGEVIDGVPTVHESGEVGK